MSKEEVCTLFESMMKLKDFESTLPHLCLPDFIYEKYNLDKPKIPDFSQYLSATATTQFMPGGMVELREPASGGIRIIEEIKVDVIADLSNNTTMIDIKDSDSDFKKVIVPSREHVTPESEPSLSLKELDLN